MAAAAFASGGPPATSAVVAAGIVAVVAIGWLTRRFPALAGLAAPLWLCVTLVALAVDLSTQVVGVACVGLAAMALARMDESRLDPGGAEIGPAWLLLVPVAILAVLGTAAVLSSVLSVEAAGAVLDGLRPLPDVLVRIVTLLVLFIVEAVTVVLEPLSRLFAEGLLENWALSERAREWSELDPDGPISDQPLPRLLVLVVRSGLLVLAVAVVWLWLARSVQRYTSSERDEEHVEREWAFSASRLGTDLADWLRSVGDSARAAVRLRAGGRTPGVRGLYVEFLKLTAARGVARRASETPHEFAPRAALLAPAVGRGVVGGRERLGSDPNSDRAGGVNRGA